MRKYRSSFDFNFIYKVRLFIIRGVFLFLFFIFTFVSALISREVIFWFFEIVEIRMSGVYFELVFIVFICYVKGRVVFSLVFFFWKYLLEIYRGMFIGLNFFGLDSSFFRFGKSWVDCVNLIYIYMRWEFRIIWRGV